jgi:hypothetical protein
MSEVVVRGWQTIVVVATGVVVVGVVSYALMIVSHENENKKDFLKTKLEYCEKVFRQNHSFELDLFQLIDYEFVNWANSQTESHVIAVMAEMKKAPKLKPEIEVLRKDVSKIPLFSIDEYRKIKRLGVRTVSFLQKMKQQYGNHVLKILYLTANATATDTANDSTNP